MITSGDFDPQKPPEVVTPETASALLGAVDELLKYPASFYPKVKASAKPGVPNFISNNDFVADLDGQPTDFHLSRTPAEQMQDHRIATIEMRPASIYPQYVDPYTSVAFYTDGNEISLRKIPFIDTKDVVRQRGAEWERGASGTDGQNLMSYVLSGVRDSVNEIRDLESQFGFDAVHESEAQGLFRALQARLKSPEHKQIVARNTGPLVAFRGWLRKIW